MKKFLALVLALVMTMSLVTIGANAKTADFSDAKEITNVEAVDVLSEMGILVGQNNVFSPKATITRGAACKIIAYLALGQAAADALTATGTIFKDVPANSAVAPYVEWCAKNGIVNGYGDKVFGLKDKVTINAFVKMLLGVIGYGQNSEFVGGGWQANVISKATQLGVMEGTEKAGYATREQAAQFALNALPVAFVTYVPYLNQYVANVSNNTNNGINTNDYENIATRFGLTYTDISDVWGNPGHQWKIGTPKKVIGNYMDTPVLTYTTGKSVCDVLVDLGVAKTSKDTVKVAELFINGGEASAYHAASVGHDANCTANILGGQGTLTKIYKQVAANGDVSYVITVVNTYLAKVGDVHVSTHYLVADSTEVVVYNTAKDGQNGTAATINGLQGYAKGDYILLNIAEVANADGTAPAGSYKTAAGDVVVDLGKASSVVGAQSVIWAEAVASRTVAGTKYALNHQFVRDDTYDAQANKAGVNPYDFKANFNWFFDTYGNLIGAVTVDTIYSYGTIKDIQWINPVGSYGYAQATIQYMDGTTASVKVSTIDGNATTYTTTNQEPGAVSGDTVGVSTSWAENKAPFFGEHLYKISGDANSVDMVQVLELTAAAVTTGVSAVSGTAGANAASPIYTNSDTVYMVRTVDTTGEYVYTQYTGFNTVPSFTGATVDYVLGSTGYAQYIYIAAATNATVSTGLVYLANLTYSYDNNTRLYTMLGAYVAGVQTPVVVNKTAFDNLTAENVYYITYANGAGTTATKVTKVETTVGTMKAIKVQVKDITADALNKGEATTWNITNATLYGAAAKDTTNIPVGSYVVVIYSAGSTTATALYAGCVADPVVK